MADITTTVPPAVPTGAPLAPPAPPVPPKGASCYSCYRNSPYKPPELTATETHIRFKNAIQGMRREGGFTDVLVGSSGDGGEFRAHKCVLAAWSPILAETLKGDLAAAAAAPGEKPAIVLEGVDKVTLEMILDYMYTGEIKLNTVTLKEHGIALFGAASLYGIVHLKDQLEVVMAAKVDDGSAFDALRVADEHGARRLREAASHHILRCMDHKKSASELKSMLLGEASRDRALAAELMERMWVERY